MSASFGLKWEVAVSDMGILMPGCLISTSLEDHYIPMLQLFRKRSELVIIIYALLEIIIT